SLGFDRSRETAVVLMVRRERSEPRTTPPLHHSFGRKYFLMLSPSDLNRTAMPRALRMNFLVRLIMPWRLPRWPNRILPVPVTLKRFLAPLLVFILGILLPSNFEPFMRRHGMPMTKGRET